MSDLQEIASVLAANGASEERIVETLKIAAGPNPQRELNEEERNIFAGTVGRAVAMMPSFRDAIALIRPFRDYTSSTLYTDRHSRVGIGELFFLEDLSPYRRASLLLHEAMHVLNNHFTRTVDFPIDPVSDNSAKDLEINSLLDSHPRTDLSMLLLPSQQPYCFPDVRSYEQYAKMMKDKGLLGSQGEEPEPRGGPGSEPQQNDGGAPSEQSESDSKSSDEADTEGSDGSATPESGEASKKDSNSADGSESSPESNGPSEESSGGASLEEELEEIASEAMGSDGSEHSDSSSHPHSSCDRSSPEREDAADELDIERASSSEQSVARNNTMARVREEAAKAKERGDRAGLRMLQQMELAMAPPKVNWRKIFQGLMSRLRDTISLGRTDYTYRRVNKRLTHGGFIFPGMVKYEPSAIMAIDTSGSMTQGDYTRLLSELEGIIKSALRAKDKFRAFCVDAKATEPKTVKSIRELDLRGGGGTAMEVSIRSVELLPRRDHPDIFILATDGGTSWQAFKRELLKRKGSYAVVVLITEDSGQFEVAKSTLAGLADVIDISEAGPKSPFS